MHTPQTSNSPFWQSPLFPATPGAAWAWGALPPATRREIPGGREAVLQNGTEIFHTPWSEHEQYTYAASTSSRPLSKLNPSTSDTSSGGEGRGGGVHNLACRGHQIIDPAYPPTRDEARRVLTGPSFSSPSVICILLVSFGPKRINHLAHG